MGYCDAARLLGVVEEIRLSVLVRVVAYNLNAVLVSANRTVGTQTVEFAGGRALGSRVELLGEIERAVRNVLVNTDCEVVFGLFLFKVFINGKHHRGGEFLRAQAVSAAYDLYAANALFKDSRANVEVQGLAERTGLFGSVEYRNLLAGLGNSRNKRVGYERSVKTDFNQPVLFA